MTIDTDKLKALALAATVPVNPTKPSEWISAQTNFGCAMRDLSPATVLELIAEVERLRADAAAGTTKVAERPDFFKWWTSVEPRSRKAMLASAHRNTEKLHALLRMAFDAAIEANAKAGSTPCGS